MRGWKIALLILQLETRVADNFTVCEQPEW